MQICKETQYQLKPQLEFNSVKILGVKVSLDVSLADLSKRGRKIAFIEYYQSNWFIVKAHQGK
jgi:hypothetical protein